MYWTERRGGGIVNEFHDKGKVSEWDGIKSFFWA